jgi:hypothetical protein
MTNKEKYGDKIIELATNTALFGLKNGKPAICEEIKCEDCDFYGLDSCKGSTYNFREWLNSEYVEPPVDWSKVAVDTPILVRDSEKNAWKKDILQNTRTEQCAHGDTEQHLGVRVEVVI